VTSALSTLRRHWRTLVLTFVWVEGLYALTNWRTIMPDHQLPLSAVDRLTPLLPWTAWIYVSVYFLPILTCALAPRDEEVAPMAVAFAAMDTLCTVMFVLYPVAYPRLGAHGWSMLALVQRLDTPRNCFPSQHVANAVLCALMLRRFDRRAGTWALAWAGVISLSTLTTKQHYAWDVLAGALIAVAAYGGFDQARRQAAAVAAKKAVPAPLEGAAA
jgi:membrane-associated phospholipid phosphatase